MSTPRILYHLARADFLERTRRYSFLVMLGLVMWIGYLSASGQFRMRVPPDHIGIINSAWVGATMTVTVSILLGWVGFYIVKGSVNRDYTTGVGQIMATTPLSRRLYLLGKWLSNFAVLGVTIIVLMLAGIAMYILFGTEGFDLLALTAPLVFIALPCMGLIAALAVLFESIHWLRGGLGNVIYFFVFLFALIASAENSGSGVTGGSLNPYMDFAGWQIIGNSVSRAAQAAYPGSPGGFAFSITDLSNPKLFHWSGIEWTADIFLSRLFFSLIAIGVVMLAAVFFDRFNPSRVLPIKRQRIDSNDPEPAPVTESVPAPNIHLTPLTDAQSHFRFDALFLAELKLFLKGQRWWWYAIAFGLIVAQLFNELEITHMLLIVSWTWPILILGGLGCRESRYDTSQIVFSAPRPLRNQLPAAWLSAFAVLALMGSGAFLRFIFAGETLSLLGWITGVCFIPSLALASGVLTGSSKTFEVIYVLWMYMLTQKAPSFDFIGMTSESPWFVYMPVAFVLMALAVLVRQRQLKNR